MKTCLVAAVILVLMTRSVQPSPVVECEGDSVDTYVQDDADCSIYWLCGDGWASEFQCSNGLHFNVRRGDCDAPRNAGCATGTTDVVTVSPVVTTTSPVTRTSVVTDQSIATEPSDIDSRKICKGARANRWHLPYPSDRTKFVKCDLNTGRGTVVSCPSGLVFNPSFQVCDWPSF